MASLLGSLPAFKGKKPKVPDFVPVDASQVQRETIAGNIAATPQAQQLAEQVNAFNREELDRAMEFALPGGKQQIQSLLSSQLRGEIPQDVADAIQRSTAYQALAGGFGGGLKQNLVARDLGLTSLSITNQAMDAASRWMSVAQAPTFDVTSMFFSPETRLAHAVSERDKQTNVQWLKNQIKAMPSPSMQAIGQVLDDIADTALSMLASYGGGGMGGGGGAGAGAKKA